METDDRIEEEDYSPRVKAARLSAQELLAHRNLDRTVPPRGGTKDYAPDGSQEQEEKLQGMYSLYRRMLAEERVNKIGNLSTAIWLEDLGLAEVTVDKNAIEVYWNKVPLAVQQAYAMMLGNKVSMEQYQVYAHLSRLGYILMRHQSREHFSWYERQIQLDEYIPIKERIKERSSAQVRDWFPPNQQEEQDSPSSGKLQKPDEVHTCGDNIASQESGKVKSASHSPVEHSTSNQRPRDSLVETQALVKKGRNEQSVEDEQMEIQYEDSRKDKTKKQEKKELSSLVLAPQEYKWDFTNINIPNVGQDSDVSEIPIPSTQLLPAGAILSKLQVIQNISLEKECSSLPKPDRTLDIAYDVYLPDSRFKKSKPGRPNLRPFVMHEALGFHPDPRFNLRLEGLRASAPEMKLVLFLELRSPLPMINHHHVHFSISIPAEVEPGFDGGRRKRAPPGR
uniref:tRNA-splicing endonuclease subunit Sen54 N-terminal domain-containing protein n=1 Tax=Branchiostoma floridae TaxID=7739 RepID=C3XYX6_BRAFL|eukprot:XP_002610737.1 hypothetical protein BRAFLDRAFT_90923 [Branchiostoma floridae]